MNSETKVGLLFLSSVVMVIAFVYYLGAFNPFASAHRLTVTYNFAGGIELGSPVRVMGIKVGKVKDIIFDPHLKLAGGSSEQNKIRIVISVSKSAWESLRSDSQFYINLAGVIGEKFIEITPGSVDAEPLKPGQIVQGEDPPRIDQMISQSYALAGKVLELVENNKGDVVSTIRLMNELVSNLNSTLGQVNKLTKRGDMVKLIENSVALTGDLRYFTGEMRSEEGQETFKLMNELLFRLKDVDKKAIKKFFQKEGIKAKLF